MSLQELLTEILQQYSLEYEKDNKVSSPYYKQLKKRVKTVFQPLVSEYGLSIKALGEQGVMLNY